MEENVSDLRAGNWQKAAESSKQNIELLQLGRNAVYRIRGDTRWYLKMPCNGKTGGIEGEINGFRYMNDALADLGFYQHPAAVRASLENTYLLTAEVPGKQLNYILYRALLRPVFTQENSIKEIFHRCGIILGKFHKEGQGIDLPPVRGLQATLQRRLSKVKSLDMMGEKISRWFGDGIDVDGDHTIVHGNCTFRNILVNGYDLSIIDFETCGSGSRYNDLARMCSDIILCRTAIAFPWKRAYRALAAFLKGYGEIFPVEREQLLKYIALYIFDRYIQVYQIKKKKESISGIPVSASRLKGLHQQLLAEDFDGVFRQAASFV